MLIDFLTFIKDKNLIEEEEKVLLAVSGGMDSMVMLDLFHRAGLDFAVAHVNYGLRGRDSDEDERLVEDTCQQFKIPLYTTKVELNLAHGASVQMEARARRYEIFCRILEQHDYQKVATAHHLDDSFETTLLNLSRGTGIRGLTGIRPIKDKIIRPLMFAGRAQINTYAKQEGITWREDTSNSMPKYQRNVLRHQVMPTFKEMNPNLLETFNHTLERLHAVDVLLREITDQIRKEYLSEASGKWLLDLHWLKSSESDLVILNEIMTAYDFNFSTVRQLMKSIERNEVGTQFLGTRFSCNVDRHQLIIGPIDQEPAGPVLIDRDTRIARIGGKRLTVSLPEGNTFSRTDDRNLVELDLDKLTFPLTVRPWKEGDWFRPLGMKGKKKISDLMIDLKIPLSLKQDVMILESSGEIAWVIGLRMDDRFKITSGTKRKCLMKVEDDV